MHTVKAGVSIQLKYNKADMRNSFTFMTVMTLLSPLERTFSSSGSKISCKAWESTREAASGSLSRLEKVPTETIFGSCVSAHWPSA